MAQESGLQGQEGQQAGESLKTDVGATLEAAIEAHRRGEADQHQQALMAAFDMGAEAASPRGSELLDRAWDGAEPTRTKEVYDYFMGDPNAPDFNEANADLVEYLESRPADNHEQFQQDHVRLEQVADQQMAEARADMNAEQKQKDNTLLMDLALMARKAFQEGDSAKQRSLEDEIKQRIDEQSPTKKQPEQWASSMWTRVANTIYGEENPRERQSKASGGENISDNDHNLTETPIDGDEIDPDAYMQRHEAHHHEDEQPAEGRDFNEGENDHGGAGEQSLKREISVGDTFIAPDGTEFIVKESPNNKEMLLLVEKGVREDGRDHSAAREMTREDIRAYLEDRQALARENGDSGAAPDVMQENTLSDSTESAGGDDVQSVEQDQDRPIQPGDLVRSNKTTEDGYYNPDKVYTVAQVRRNNNTGRLEYHLSDIDSKDGGQTNAYWLTEDDGVFRVGESPRNDEGEPVVQTVDLGPEGPNENSPGEGQEGQNQAEASIDGDEVDPDAYMQRHEAHHHEDEQPVEGRDVSEDEGIQNPAEMPVDGNNNAPSSPEGQNLPEGAPNIPQGEGHPEEGAQAGPDATPGPELSPVIEPIEPLPTEEGGPTDPNTTPGPELPPAPEPIEPLPTEENETEEVEDNLEFTAGISARTLKDLVHRAMELADKQQRERTALNIKGDTKWEKLKSFFPALKEKGAKGVMRMIGAGIKYSPLFKVETQRRQGEKLLVSALDKLGTGTEGEKKYLSMEEWRDVLEEEGVTFTPDQEVAYLDSISHELFTQGVEGFAIHGNGEAETPAMIELRSGLRESVLAFVVAEGAEGLTDEQRTALYEQYTGQIGGLVDTYRDKVPEFGDRESIEVYADNARRLLERSLAVSRHDDGMQRLEEQLAQMRIDVGIRQMGAYNNLETKYLERTLNAQRALRVGSAVAKASAVVGSWVGFGALASGASTWASQSGSTSGARVGATLVGGALAGPVGMAIGFGAGVAVSAAWGRHLGRERQRENAHMAAISSASSGSRERTEMLNSLSPEMTAYQDVNRELYGFFEVKPGVDPEQAGIGDWQLRGNLSQVEVADLVVLAEKLQVRVNAEAASFEEVREDSKKRPLNLFEARDAATLVDERNQMIEGLKIVGKELREKYDDVTFGPENGPHSTLVQYMTAQAAEQSTALELKLEEYEKRVKKSINVAGRWGGLVGGGASAVVGLATAGLTEAFTGGQAQTIFDAFGNRISTPNVMPPLPGGKASGGNVEISTAANYGQSGVKVNGSQAVFTNAEGKSVTVTLGKNGELSTADIDTLKTNGIEVTNQDINLPHKGHEAMDDLIKQLGGKKYEIDHWLDNNTPRSDGTELGADIVRRPNGSIVLVQHPGIARGDGLQVDVIDAAHKGQVYARVVGPDGTAIEIPAKVKDGVINAIISKDSPLQQLFANGRHPETLARTWGFSVDVGHGKGHSSISTVMGLNRPRVAVETLGSTKIDINIVPSSTTTDTVQYGTTIPGLVPPLKTETVLGKRQAETAPSESPAPEQEPTPTPAPAAEGGGQQGGGSEQSGGMPTQTESTPTGQGSEGQQGGGEGQAPSPEGTPTNGNEFDFSGYDFSNTQNRPQEGESFRQYAERVFGGENAERAMLSMAAKYNRSIVGPGVPIANAEDINALNNLDPMYFDAIFEHAQDV